jgi:flagellar FliL protein
MNKRVLIGAAVAVALAIQIGLAVFFLNAGEAEPEAEPAADQAARSQAFYHSLRPPFVVTLPGGNRQYMMQADLAVMAREQAAIEAVLRHAPLIRAEVIRYLSDLDPERIQSDDGREQMLESLRDLINVALQREAETVAVEAVLFNNLVMQ